MSGSADKATMTKGLADQIGKRKPFEMPEQEAYLNLVRTHSILSAAFERLFAAHGLTDPQYNALRVLRGNKRPMPVYRIAEQMVTRQPDITRLIDRLESAGLVSRHRCEEDRRVVWVELTKRGDAVLKKLDRPVRDLHRGQLGCLGKKKLRQLNELLCEARSGQSDRGSG